MISALIDALDRRHSTLGIAPVRSGLVLGLDRDPTAKVTLLLFGEDGRPVAVAKTTRSEGETGLLEHEYDTLVQLARTKLERTGTTVPRPLLLERICGHLVLVTTAVNGSPLLVRYHSPGHARSARLVALDFETAGRWLARFQRDTASGRRDCHDVYLDTATDVLTRFQAAHGWGRLEEQFVDRLHEQAHSLTGVQVPLVTVHGDYCLGNVLTNDRTVTGVVDWELGQGAGPPFTDLFKFATSYASYLDRALPSTGAGVLGHPGWAEARDRWTGPGAWPNLVGFLYAFAGQGWFPRIVRDYLLDGYERLGVPAPAGDLFLPLFVAQQAVTLADPVYRNGYRNLFLALAAKSVGPVPVREVAS